MSPLRLVPLLHVLAVASFLTACGGSSGSGNADAGPDAAPGRDDDAAPIGIDAGVDVPETCEFLGCEDGFGRTCESDPLVVDCTAFGATCGDFTDTESGAPFEWCDCGDLGELEGFCLGGRVGITCLEGLGGLADCGAGMECVPREGSPFGIGCDCNNVEDGVCPSLSCGGDPDCKDCTPDCEGKECGDNGCGGTCGTCAAGAACTPDGTCEEACVPDCAGKECGDDGCGGSCGTCEGECDESGQCEGTCVPSCEDAECGSDGCGGSCGTCSGGLECNGDGRCDCPFFGTIVYDFTLERGADWSGFFGVVLTARHINLDGSESQVDSESLCDRDACPGGERTTTWRKPYNGCEPRVRLKRTYHVLFAGSCETEEIVEGLTDITIPPATLDGRGGCTVTPL
jgi:hypothetical protein